MATWAIYRGYYTAVGRNKFYFRVVKAIFYILYYIDKSIARHFQRLFAQIEP